MSVAKPHSDAQAALALEREAEVMRRRINGQPFRDIAEDLEMSASGAYEAFKRAKQRLVDDVALAADEHRTVWRERFERAIAALASRIDAGDAEAIRALAIISDRATRLDGLDAPTKFTSDSRVEVVITGAEGV